MSTNMSLREKSLDLLFNEFVNTYFTHSSVARALVLTRGGLEGKSSSAQKTGKAVKNQAPLPETLSLPELLASSATARLYESTHELLRIILEGVAETSEAKKSKLAKSIKNPKAVSSGDISSDISSVATLLRSHWKLSRLYVFKVEKASANQAIQAIVPQYMYPAKVNSKTLSVNNSFISQLKNPKTQHEVGESIKHYFNIVTPRMQFLLDAGEESLLIFYEHPMIPLVSSTLVNRLLGEVLITYARCHSLEASIISKLNHNPAINKAVKEATKEVSKEATKPATNIPVDKIYLYQRVVSQLMSLTGDSLTEIEEAIKFLFQTAGLTQAVITDKKNTLIAVYSTTKPIYNTLKSGKQAPESLLKEYQTSEKANLARTISTSSTSKKGKSSPGSKTRSSKFGNAHLLKLFTKQALHPQKQYPNFPFNHYVEILERLLVKRAMIKS